MDPYVPFLNPCTNNLNRGQCIINGCGDVRCGQSFVIQIIAQNEGYLRLYLRLHNRRGGNFRPQRHVHIIEQHAVIGLIDAELGMHRFRCQPGLAPNKTAPLAEPAFRVDLLNPVRSLNSQVADQVTDRRAGLP